MQGYALNFLTTFKDFPPSQAPGDWSLGKLQKQVEGMTSTGAK
jgi:arylsulfatase